ncbi:hypothetical protein HARCEL1_12575 [Halococcoides cellulosivorans]|uniref:Uncharacterized protein n=1 Tax=Halococcoides cellulosivorans TaxID=1679096 RepID=A0A2R4X3V0_9EURY|nr:hypothetical protein HARCEL1_12575 [Halococcoides cellulosivorans]
MTERETSRSGIFSDDVEKIPLELGEVLGDSAVLANLVHGTSVDLSRLLDDAEMEFVRDALWDKLRAEFDSTHVHVELIPDTDLDLEAVLRAVSTEWDGRKADMFVSGRSDWVW